MFLKRFSKKQTRVVTKTYQKSPTKPFYKRRKWKIAFLIFGVFAMIAVAVGGYVFTQISRSFQTDTAKRLPFFKTIREGLDNKPDIVNDNGRTNILLVGMGGDGHPGGKLTDSIMVLSVDLDNNKVAMLSIPRDLYIRIPDHKFSRKINEVYFVGEEESPGSGIALMKKALNDILGVPIHYYVSVDFKGFEKFIDELGGVDVTVEKTIYDPYYPDDRMQGYSPFYIKAGDQHLDGKTALKFARSRETSSDFDRAARQQKILLAVKDKTLKLGFLTNPKKIIDTISIVGDHVRTDLGISQLRSLVEVAKNITPDQAVSKVLTNGPGEPLIDDTSSGTYYLLPRAGDYSQIQQIAQNIFSLEVKQTASIEIANGSNIYGAATRLSTYIKSLGYQVVNISKTSTPSSETIIYDYTQGKKPVVVQTLAEKLNAKVVTETPKNSGTNVDVSIVIGTDFKDPTPKATQTTQQSTNSSAESTSPTSTSASEGLTSN